ncbi:MAG TPA: phytoene/squalene synthase family protein [Acidimicrobiales bacterium]|nr:phytoene/squalene synthase family protein [Acidimicrobiales bacterium]
MTGAAVTLAYKHCEEITRTRARNFYYGIRLLPAPKRSAMCALYAMARRIDDVGDDLYHPPGRESPTDARLRALEEIRQSMALLSKAVAGEPAAVPPGDPVLVALADAATRFPLPLDALDELVQGCEWDVTGRRYETFDELVEYCRRVAGTIGRLSLAIYGSSSEERAAWLAEALGVALQLTNILRDLVEDRDLMGRVYLPLADRERFGVGPELEGSSDDLAALVCFETGRASEWYERGLPLLELLDRRSRACTATMAGIYRHLLDEIRLHPQLVLHERVSLSTKRKLGIAALAIARGAA